MCNCCLDCCTTFCRWRSLANFSAGLSSGGESVYEVCALRLWEEIATGEWDADMAKARAKTLQKFFQDGTAPADSSTARLVLGKVDSPGSSEYEPVLDSEEADDDDEDYECEGEEEEKDESGEDIS